MKVFNALKYKKSFFYGIIAAILIAVIFPLIQTGFFQNSFKAWFLTMIKSPLNLALYVIYSLLFGVVISLQVYNLKNPKLCKDCNIKKGVSTGYIGALGGFLIGVCPACIGLLGLIFPLGISLTLTYYGWLFLLISILILLISIYFLGGFKKG